MAVHGFRRTLGGRIVLRIDDVERGILTDLVSQLVELVTPDEPWGEDEDPLARMVGIDPLAERPDDPAAAHGCSRTPTPRTRRRRRSSAASPSGRCAT